MSEDINPFTCFNLDPALTIDWNQLDQIYYAMQNATHPDRFITQAPSVRAAAAQKSAAINVAYQRLKDPIERLWAIIEAHGHIVDRKQNVDNHPDIIVDVFELQEMKENLQSASQYQDFNNHLRSLIEIAQRDFIKLIDERCFDQAIVKIYWIVYLNKL